jgi:hypothetical protein
LKISAVVVDAVVVVVGKVDKMLVHLRRHNILPLWEDLRKMKNITNFMGWGHILVGMTFSNISAEYLAGLTP